MRTVTPSAGLCPSGLAACAGCRELYAECKAGTSDAQHEETIQDPAAGVTFVF